MLSDSLFKVGKPCYEEQWDGITRPVSHVESQKNRLVLREDRNE